MEVLRHLGVSSTTWYRKPTLDPKPRGRPRKPLDPARAEPIRTLCRTYPYWGYKRMAVIARRDLDRSYTDREVYRIMKTHNLLQKREPRKAALRQTKHLYELLPQAPNELWQMDVTYIRMPQGSWWYAVTVIDYHSRYLLACELGPFQNAQSAMAALDVARAEAERLRGPLTREPTLVTDNGTCFTARKFQRHIKDLFEHVRIQYRMPQQLGLLERFHATLKTDEVYWNLYQGPAHARQCLAEFRHRYNWIRPHWALRPADDEDPLTPADVFVHDCCVVIPKWQGWARNCRTMLMEAGYDVDDATSPA